MEFPKGHMRLYLTDIGEPFDNCLRVVVEETTAGTVEPLNVGDQTITVRPILPDENGRAFEFVWESYVAYAVRNESFYSAEKGDVADQGTYRTRRKSAFLDFVSATTFADDTYPGPLTHWELSALNHVLDVIGAKAPRIRVIRGSPVKAID